MVLLPALGCFFMYMHWLILSLNLEKRPSHSLEISVLHSFQNSAVHALVTLAFLHFHIHYFQFRKIAGLCRCSSSLYCSLEALWAIIVELTLLVFWLLGYSCLLPYVHCLRTIASYIGSVSLTVSDKKVNLVPITLIGLK